MVPGGFNPPLPTHTRLSHCWRMLLCSCPWAKPHSPTPALPGAPIFWGQMCSLLKIQDTSDREVEEGYGTSPEHLCTQLRARGLFCATAQALPRKAPESIYRIPFLGSSRLLPCNQTIHFHGKSLSLFLTEESQPPPTMHACKKKGNSNITSLPFSLAVLQRQQRTQPHGDGAGLETPFPSAVTEWYLAHHVASTYSSVGSF